MTSKSRYQRVANLAKFSRSLQEVHREMCKKDGLSDEEIEKDWKIFKRVYPTLVESKEEVKVKDKSEKYSGISGKDLVCTS